MSKYEVIDNGPHKCASPDGQLLGFSQGTKIRCECGQVWIWYKGWLFSSWTQEQ